MKYDTTKLLTFVLGELSEQEAANIQKDIDADPELKRIVDEIRQIVEMLIKSLKKAPFPEDGDADETDLSKWTSALKLYLEQLKEIPVDWADLRLVLDNAKRLYDKLPGDTDILGLIQAGYEGLKQAKDTFDPQSGQEFRSFATRMIRAAMLDQTRTSEWVPRLTSSKARFSAYMPIKLISDGFKNLVELASSVVCKNHYNACVYGPGMPALMRTPGELVKYYESPSFHDVSEVDLYDSQQTARYLEFTENEFLKPENAPFSTFSVDVDTASYSVMRRYLKERNERPPADAVRLEEFINYFRYDYAPPTDGKPFATYVDVAACPWNSSNLLARIALKGKEFPQEERPSVNLVFLIDVSGSMGGGNRLPLVKKAMTELTEMLAEHDRVGIVTYADNTRVLLPSVSGREKRAIIDSIDELSAGGCTYGAGGIQEAYKLARKYFTKEGQNRVILCTDGDFNVGATSDKELQKLIEKEANLEQQIQNRWFIANIYYFFWPDEDKEKQQCSSMQRDLDDRTTRKATLEKTRQQFTTTKQQKEATKQHLLDMGAFCKRGRDCSCLFA